MDGEARSSPRVLVVDSRPEARRMARDWLEEAGMTVTECPGPQAPRYLCPWAEGGRCGLPDDADVVVLNLWLETDTLMRGTPGGEVLIYYLARGKPVVALTGWGDAVRPLGEHVVIVERPVSREDLLQAVRSLLLEPAQTPA